jgi:hypothetical protein
LLAPVALLVVAVAIDVTVAVAVAFGFGVAVTPEPKLLVPLLPVFPGMGGFVCEKLRVW